MSALLVVFHPRRIPAAVAAFDALDADIAYISGGNEAQACALWPEVMAGSEYDHLIVCADDCIVTQEAFDAVAGALEDGVEVATGWCTLDSTHPLSNLTDRPVTGDTPHEDAYHFMLADDVREQEPLFPTGFAGLALTGMSREMWERFPMACYGPDSVGWASDFHLSVRLRDAGIPVTAVRDGFVQHLKQRWQHHDTLHEHRLLIRGEIPRSVTWSLRDWA